MRGELSNKMSVAFYACLQFLRICALIFSACGHAAADMPLGLIDIKQLAHLMIQCRANRFQPLGEILVFRCDELELFRPSPNPQANAGKYPHSHPCPLRFSG